MQSPRSQRVFNVRLVKVSFDCLLLLLHIENVHGPGYLLVVAAYAVSEDDDVDDVDDAASLNEWFRLALKDSRRLADVYLIINLQLMLLI